MLLGSVFCEVLYLPHTAVTGIVKKGCIFSTGGGGIMGTRKKNRSIKRDSESYGFFLIFMRTAILRRMEMETAEKSEGSRVSALCPERNKLPKVKIGFRVGMLTVTAPTRRRKNGYTVWECCCGCGGKIYLDTRCLQRGTITDCGCRTRIKPGQRDITGMRFGMLTAVEPTDLRSGGTVVWRCRCDCGREVLSSLHQLRSGYRKSCGCLSHPPIKDFVGKRFGRLTVTAYAGKRKGMHRWRCRCDCGRETVVGQTLLQTGKTKSCGCLQSEIYQENLKLVDGTSVTILETYKKKQNRKNTSGYTGVYLDKKQGKWIAQIGFKGRNYYLGAYCNKQDAVKARQQGEKMHDDFLAWYYAKHLHPDRKNKETAHTPQNVV